MAKIEAIALDEVALYRPGQDVTNGMRAGLAASGSRALIGRARDWRDRRDPAIPKSQAAAKGRHRSRRWAWGPARRAYAA